jgi:hypothetical protein
MYSCRTGSVATHLSRTRPMQARLLASRGCGGRPASAGRPVGSTPSYRLIWSPAVAETSTSSPPKSRRHSGACSRSRAPGLRALQASARSRPDTGRGPEQVGSRWLELRRSPIMRPRFAMACLFVGSAFRRAGTRRWPVRHGAEPRSRWQRRCLGGRVARVRGRRGSCG